MTEFNVKEHVEEMKSIRLSNPNIPPSDLSNFQGGVGDEVSKVKIKHSLETRPHKFSNGVADVCNKLFIEIEFGEAVIQPHTAFEEQICSAIIEELAGEVSGLWENQDFDLIDDEAQEGTPI